MMQIPAKMVMEMVEEAVEEDIVSVDELEMIKQELAAMEAIRAMARRRSGCGRHIR